MSDMVKVTKNGAIWEIVFDRPKANAISVAATRHDDEGHPVSARQLKTSFRSRDFH